MMIYMRTQLKEIEVHGGALLKPAFTMFKSLDHNDISNVMFGRDVLVHIFTGSEESDFNFTLPRESAWVNLGNYEMIPAGATITLRPSGPLAMFQRMGSVVPLQKFEGKVDSVLDIRKNPIILSISLLQNEAFGHVYVEDGVEGQWSREIHQVWVEKNFIGFRQQDFRTQNLVANDTII